MYYRWLVLDSVILWNVPVQISLNLNKRKDYAYKAAAYKPRWVRLQESKHKRAQAKHVLKARAVTYLFCELRNFSVQM